MLIFAPENHLQKRAQRGGGLRDEVYNMRMEETCTSSEKWNHMRAGTPGACVPEPRPGPVALFVCILLEV